MSDDLDGAEGTGAAKDLGNKEEKVFWLDTISWKKKALILALIALMIYGGMILADVFWLRSTLVSAFGPPPDLGIFQFGLRPS